MAERTLKIIGKEFIDEEKIFTFCVLVLLVSCSSDKVFSQRKKGFFGGFTGALQKRN